ncbi:MAG: ubiquinone biosynthesis regulatory protein kinase UbiB, partial [Pseudomonadales bacterium]|nr:ubiquinone biosynthesis regulatory protein kinase UbiB [Pseudomonadales bacterium]
LKFLLFPIKAVPIKHPQVAVALRCALEELGPIFVKFGQVLSTRRDLFDADTSNELQKLQDQVPPFDEKLARQVIEDSLGQSIETVFSQFESAPLASASVAQVHAATLMSGEDVVVKVIRPGIEKSIQQDLKVMHLLAQILLKVWADASRLHPDEIVSDYEKIIFDELNLQLEAANASQLRKNWLDSGKLYVPEIYWDYCRENVMVMERIYGISSADIAQMQARDVDMKKLAHLGVEIFFTQVFQDNFFHADMHPGNVFIDISDPENPSYIGIDCAIIGSLTEDDKAYLAKNLLAFFNQDYLEVARLHVQSGWVPAETDVREFESVIRSVCEPIFQKPIKDISFARVLISLFQTARRFDMEVQPQLVLLQKTLLNIEGMGRQIYPDLDLWETAAPFMEDWMKQRLGVGHVLEQISENAPKWLSQLPDVPQLAYNALLEVQSLSRNNSEQTKLLNQLNNELSRNRKQRSYSRFGGLVLIAALLALTLPLTGLAPQQEAVIGASVLGSLGIYWMFIKP